MDDIAIVSYSSYKKVLQMTLTRRQVPKTHYPLKQQNFLIDHIGENLPSLMVKAIDHAQKCMTSCKMKKVLNLSHKLIEVIFRNEIVRKQDLK